MKSWPIDGWVSSIQVTHVAELEGVGFGRVLWSGEDVLIEGRYSVGDVNDPLRPREVGVWDFIIGIVQTELCWGPVHGVSACDLSNFGSILKLAGYFLSLVTNVTLYLHTLDLFAPVYELVSDLLFHSGWWSIHVVHFQHTLVHLTLQSVRLHPTIGQDWLRFDFKGVGLLRIIILRSTSSSSRWKSDLTFL